MRQVEVHRNVQWGMWLVPENLPRKMGGYPSSPFVHIKSTLCLSVQAKSKTSSETWLDYDPNASCLKHSARCLCPVGRSWPCPAASELCRRAWLLLGAQSPLPPSSPGAFPAHLSPLCSSERGGLEWLQGKCPAAGQSPAEWTMSHVY